ncbi:hypothetical protein FRC02_012424 [Tulasnella sp. 418]|nr:hypothetical protein FRC02_012424 [Tulasnella sp. 418]
MFFQRFGLIISPLIFSTYHGHPSVFAQSRCPNLRDISSIAPAKANFQRFLRVPMISQNLGTSTNICQVCGANRAQRFHFTMRTRHSTSCYKTHAVTFKSLLWEGTLKDLGDHEAINLLAVVPENSALKAASSTRINLKLALKNTGLSRVPSCGQNTSQPWGQNHDD